jgi:cytochrome oxidase Cu insertion factor (SCO1/SenC/PrrC family)
MLSLLLFGFGLLAAYSGRNIPGFAGAPQVGQKVPEFSLADSDGKPVSLSQLLSAPLANGSHSKGVLLVFYRGYW